MPYAAVLLPVLAVLLFFVFWYSKPGSRERLLWQIGTGALVLLIARFFVWLSKLDSWEKHHPVRIELLRGMAAELVVTFFAVVVIERLVAHHETKSAASLREQLEAGTVAQFDALASVLRRLLTTQTLDMATLWSLERVERNLCDAEATVLRLQLLTPTYRQQAEDFLVGASAWKERALDCHGWLNASASPDDRAPALAAVTKASRDLLETMDELRAKTSVVGVAPFFTLLNRNT